MALQPNATKPAPGGVSMMSVLLVFSALLEGARSSSSAHRYDEESSFRKATQSAISNFQVSETKAEEGVIATEQVPDSPSVLRVFSSKTVEFHRADDRLQEANKDSESAQIHLDFDIADAVFQPDQVRAAITPRDSKDAGSRRLQTCAAGSGITVTSSLLPLLEGCLTEMDGSTDTEAAYESDYGLIVPYEAFEGDNTEYWTALHRETTSSTTYAIGCVSMEAADEVDPWTATWICLDGETAIVASDSQFGVECGCDDTSPTPTTIASTCDEGESFTVSTVLVGADGCYEVDPDFTINDERYYVQSGASDGDGFWVYAFALNDDLASTVHWWIAFVANVDSTSFSSFHHCVSLEEASAVHPADVSTWNCNFGSSSTDTATAGELSIDCGCSAETDSSITSAAGTPGPTPEATLQASSPAPEASASTVAPSATSTVAPSATGARGIDISPSPTSTMAPSAAGARGIDITPSPTAASTLSSNVTPTSPPAVASTSLPTAALTSPPAVAATGVPTAASTSPPTVESTSSPTAATTSLPVLAPTASPTTGNEPETSSPISSSNSTEPPASAIAPTACGDDESVQITSAVLPEIEGCFQKADLSDSGSTIEAWSVDGDSGPEQVVIASAVVETEERYFVMFVSADTDLSVVYCFSAEETSAVHPSEATWLCDLDGSDTYALVTDADVSMACGCTASTEEAASNGGEVGRSLPSWSLMAFATCLTVFAGALPRGL